MQSSIDMIIANDRKARDAVARAEDVRRSAADELAEKKAEISKNIEKEAQAAASEAKRRLESAGTRDTEKREAHAKEVCRKMDELYAAKKAEWIEKYTAEIIGG